MVGEGSVAQANAGVSVLLLSLSVQVVVVVVVVGAVSWGQVGGFGASAGSAPWSEVEYHLPPGGHPAPHPSSSSSPFSVYM